MSGSSGGSSTTNSVPQWMEEGGRELWNRSKEAADQPYQQYQGQRVAGWTPYEQQAATHINNNAAGANFHQTHGAIEARRGIFDDTTGGIRDVQGASINRGAVRDVQADQVQAERIGSAQMNRGAVRDASTNSFTGSTVQDYMNPYEDTVVQQTTQDMARQRDMDQIAAEERAMSRGAFTPGMGTGEALLKSENNRNFYDRLGATTGQLRRQGFNDAAGIFASDAGRDLQATLANQGVDERVATGNTDREQRSREFNASNALTAGMANQGANLQAATANQGMDWNVSSQNATMDQQARLANQDADRARMDTRLRAMNDATDAELALSDTKARRYDDVRRMGLDGRGIAQSRLDIANEDWQNQQNWGRNQSNFLGGIINGIPHSQTQTQRTSANPWMTALGIGSSAAGIYGMVR